MQIRMIPVAGAEVVSLRVETEVLTVNGTAYEFASLPSEGPVRVLGQVLLIEYGELGGVSSCCLTSAHEIVVFSPNLPPSPPTPIDAEAEAEAALLVMRASWVAQRWQMIAVLGEERWQTIVDFATGPLSTWAMKAVIDNAVDIPRNSETVDLLAYILGLSDEETDDLFRRAVSLVA